MKNYAISIYITVPLTAVSLGIALLLHYCGNGTEAEFWCNVCLGIFGSGLLTVLVSCVGYASEKKKTMEGFYYSTKSILHKVGSYDGSWNRDQKINFYVDFYETEQFVWDSQLGDIYLITDLARQQFRYIYDKIYSPIINLSNEIGERVFHFKLYKDGEKIPVAVLDKLIAELEPMILKSEQKVIEDDGQKVTIQSIRNEFVPSISKELNGRYYDLMYRKAKREDA